METTGRSVPLRLQREDAQTCAELADKCEASQKGLGCRV